MNEQERQKRREEILQRLVIGQSSIRGYLVRKRFHGWTREDKRMLIDRNAAIREIVANEQAFLDSLAHIIKYYAQPLRLDGVMIGAKDLEIIFGNMESIYKIHSTALEQLVTLYESSFPLVKGVVNIFDFWVKGGKLFVGFAANSKYALNLIQRKDNDKSLVTFLKQTEQRLISSSRGAQLPVTIPAIYSLILSYPAKLAVSIEKVTTNTPECHEDREGLCESLAAMQQIMAAVKTATDQSPLRAELLSIASKFLGYDILAPPNQTKEISSTSTSTSTSTADSTTYSNNINQSENSLSSSITNYGIYQRKFLREGKASVANQKRHLFLFSDVLLIALSASPTKKMNPKTAGAMIKKIGSASPLSSASSSSSSSSSGSSTSYEKLAGNPKQYQVKSEILLRDASIVGSQAAPKVVDRGRSRLPLDRLSANPRNIIGVIKEKDKFSEENSFVLNTGKEEVYILQFDSVDEKQIWLKEIKDAIQRAKPKEVFGVPLLQLLVAEQKRNLGIPYVVFIAVNYLLQNAIATEDLFTQSGSSAEVDELRNAVEAMHKDTGEIQLKGTDPRNVADLLKLYFRELPEPLFPYELYLEIINLKGTKDQDKYISDVRQLLARLPGPNRTLLQYLIHFFVRLSFCSEVNRMTSSTLALVFGPELIRPREMTLESHLMFGKIQRVLRTLIDNYLTMFCLDK